MNVTLKLPDDLCREAKHRGIDESKSLSAWVACLVEREIAAGKAVPPPPRTLNEIRYCYRNVEKRDPAFSKSLQRWYQGILANAAEVSFLPIDRQIAEQAADFRACLGMPYNDALIAATAQVHRLTLATPNVSDFAKTGISIVNPWGAEPGEVS